MRRPWEVSRRTVLRGAGTAIGLPLLEAMLPGQNRARAAGVAAPRRLVFYVFVGGTPETTDISDEGVKGCLRPRSTGPGYETTTLLKPLEDLGLRDDILIVTGLHNDHCISAVQGHASLAQAILTSVDPGQNCGNNGMNNHDNISASISVDQFAANSFRRDNPNLPLRSLYLCNPTSGEFLGDQTMVFTDATTRLQPTLSPSEAFHNVFGDGTTDPATLKKRLAYKQSVLDYAMRDADRIRGKLGTADKQTLERYLTGVHELEIQIAATSQAGGQCATGGLVPTNGALMPEHFNQMSEVLKLAFQCDRTRVAVVHLLTHDKNYGLFLGAPNDGYPNYHNDIQHGASVTTNSSRTGYNDAAVRMDAYMNAASWNIETFGKLIRKLKDTPDAEGGTLLDSTAAVGTSELSYGNGHSPWNLPVILAGGAGGFTPGRHIVVQKQPIGNLWVTMLNATGVKDPAGRDVTTFGTKGTQAISLG